MQRNQLISRWVIGYAVLQLLSAVAFGALAYLNRGLQFPELVENEAAAWAIGLFANRNLGLSLALIAALLLRNRAMLFVLFLLHFAIDLLDFFLVLGQGVGSLLFLVIQLLFFGLLLWLPTLLCLRWLWQAEAEKSVATPSVRAASAETAPAPEPLTLTHASGG
ncbi:hypothetical protein KFU94_28760 [Chloroflexi bacterium TSY]|nr:hypothetical protein [Chloroflexi bacterium TSY]